MFQRTNLFLLLLVTAALGACGDRGGKVCTANTPNACEYPSLALDYTEARGLRTVEPKTGRTLPLVARIPKREGPLPVVIWSHGGGFFPGGENQSTEWSDVFASHGYVALHIGHAALLDGNVATYCMLAAVPANECVPGETEDENGLLAIGRSYDVAAVLDDLPRLSAASVADGGPALDLDRVALAGWSGGSRGPMMAMGARNKPSVSAPIFTNAHPRPVAAIFMSPAGPPFAGWYDSGADSTGGAMRGPTFTATGANDVKPEKVDLSGEVRRHSFEMQPKDGQRWLLYSNLPRGTGGHGTYNLADLGSSDPKLARLSRAIASVARAFLDAHLKSDEAARTWLSGNDAKVLAGNADWEHK